MEFRTALHSEELNDERLHASTLELRRALLDETEKSERGSSGDGGS